MVQRETDVKEHVGNASRVLAVLRVSRLAPRGIGHDPEPAFADDSFIVDLSRAREMLRPQHAGHRRTTRNVTLPVLVP